MADTKKCEKCGAEVDRFERHSHCEGCGVLLGKRAAHALSCPRNKLQNGVTVCQRHGKLLAAGAACRVCEAERGVVA